MTIEERASLLYNQRKDDYIAEISINSLSADLKKAYISGAESQKTIMLARLIEFMNGMMLDTRVKERLYKYLSEE